MTSICSCHRGIEQIYGRSASDRNVTACCNMIGFFHLSFDFKLYGPSGEIFPIAIKVIKTNEKHVFCYMTMFVEAKTRGIDAEREKGRISTLNSSSCATMHKEKNLGRPAKIGQNQSLGVKS